MYKTFEYRLFTNRSQHKRLLSCLAESRLIYNETLEMLKAHYQSSGKFLSRYDFTYRFKGRGGEHVPQSTVQTLADRLDKALKRFFRRKDLGRRVGFPRFKSANRGTPCSFANTVGGGTCSSTPKPSGCTSRANSALA
jgi:putative transposase